jgi:hypothetical protein
MDWARLLPDANHPSYPIIRKIVADLQRDHALWCDKVRQFELASANSSAAEPTEEAERLQREVQALAVDIESYVAEINYLGVEFDVSELFSERR